MKLWGGRFETGPSEVFERFSGSLHFDKRLVQADIRGSQAFARELGRVGILSENEVSRLVSAFDDIGAKARQPSFFEGAVDEDVHTVVIRKLKEKVGGLADKIHTGRSRNEQVSLDARLWLRDEIDAVKTELTAFLREAPEAGAKVPRCGDPGLYTSEACSSRSMAALSARLLRDVLSRLGEARSGALTSQCDAARLRRPRGERLPVRS